VYVPLACKCLGEEDFIPFGMVEGDEAMTVALFGKMT
jgi:hypothetical protein